MKKWKKKMHKSVKKYLREFKRLTKGGMSKSHPYLIDLRETAKKHR